MTIDTPRRTMEEAATGGISFGLTERQQELREMTAAFVRRECVPHEHVLLTPEGIPWELVQELRVRSREAGLFGPSVAPRWGGLGLDWRSIAVVFEEAGTSLLGPLALNCAAPDEGNIHLLGQVANPQQQERFLAPLARGEVRSCFAMTEPAPGAGSDPAMLRTRAEWDGKNWVLNGHKWYITGAQGAAFAIVMARTSDEANGATMFLVPAGTAGFEIVRTIPSMDHTSFFSGHTEIRIENCRVGPEAVLGEVGRGFEYAQVRLAPARLTHCMRWLGVARRSQHIAARWAGERQSAGRPLAEHQMVQAMLADSAIDLQASRLLIWHAAWTLDSGAPARGESQMAKVFVAEAVGRVVDRAVQICGAMGISDDLLLGLFYREVRAFRIYDGASEVHRAAIARRVMRNLQKEGSAE